MLPSSVRRVVATASPSLTSTATRATTATGCFTLSSRPNGHQRRFSSSKPSSPDNGSKELAQSIPATKASESKSSSGSEKRKRKAKDASAAQAKQLPSVPSTQHLSPEALGLSTFFSLHRPISVTHAFPKTVTDEDFAAIFTRPTLPRRLAEVRSTLASAVNQLEGGLAKMSLNNNSSAANHHDAQQAAHEADEPETLSYSRADGTRVTIRLGGDNAEMQLHSMSGQFLPFSPPPAPVAAGKTGSSTASAEAAAAEDLDAAEMPSHRVYKAVLTIEETTDEHGQVKVVAHSPELIEDDAAAPAASAPRTFLERMALRQLRYEDYRDRRAEDEMLAISVRRQKKLKMKKKKYKKLMRRTRNERRKLDRI